MTEYTGPTLPISKEIHSQKYRLEGEPFMDGVYRFSSTLSDNDKHRHALTDIVGDMRFLPAGRVQAAIGSPRKITPWNCFVSGTIADDFNDIMEKAKEAGHTMRLGGGIGYDFSTLRPRGALIKSLGSQSSGPVSFMSIYDAICGTIASAGHRRGAQMGVLRVDHPDIWEFVSAKRNEDRLTRFNISVGVTDQFMKAVKNGSEFALKWRGKVYNKVDARTLWNAIMRSTWDWAEPGILFIDRINQWNNLYYCETIAATNPCGEQPLPPYGACLLGSFNLTKYIDKSKNFDSKKLINDIFNVVRAMDNIIDVGIYPLPQQEEEGKSKRRMGLGITGLANTLEHMGYSYGSDEFIQATSTILKILRDNTYLASTELAKEKGSFPLFDKERYLNGKFIKTLPEYIRENIATNGIRNSHLLSIAPTGTISLSADNISSGIEPVFTYEYNRTIQQFNDVKVEKIQDFGYREWGVKGKTANEVSVQDHVKVLATAQQFIDSSVSKTCNVGDQVTWDEFKDVYMMAYDLGAKGVTTFRAAGKRYGILNEVKEEKIKEEYVDDDDSVEACYFDPVTGKRTCE
jgi:ribonucleoside-diphosphate reductase alpha chain